MYVRGTEKEREIVSVCESVCVCGCVCLCVLVGVCVCRGMGSRNRVEERGCELESEYEITRRRYSSSLLVVITRTSYMKTATKTMLELFYALQRSRGHKECLKRS